MAKTIRNIKIKDIKAEIEDIKEELYSLRNVYQDWIWEKKERKDKRFNLIFSCIMIGLTFIFLATFIIDYCKMI